ncbi:hypothetical protein ACN27G_21205 [Plantactinospora sp. WMMB334]|uniref:nSTAND1 domain-containing NTPase n=1 Tax=Plantactinospora sp. WMMB334 TaxID=3404119 RepID=UPI003B9424FE
MTALSEAAGGRVTPSLAVLLAYVKACGGDPQEWEARWRKLASDLAPPTRMLEDEDSRAPYRGLSTFESSDAKWFFGRDRLIHDLSERVAGWPFLAVFAPSGSGKSSLLRAGLIPGLTGGSAQEGSGWLVVLITPGERPVDELAIHLANLNKIAAGPVSDALRGDPASVGLTIRQVLAARVDADRLLVVVDQFEELFTLCRDERLRSTFVSILLAASAESGTRVVLGIRADFYAQCATFPELVTALRDRQILVGVMDETDLRRVISGPAERAGLAVEPALVELAASDARGQPGALPLLSHALRETWRRRQGKALTLAAYLEAGGVQGAIAQTAERLYGEFGEGDRQLVRDIFLRLTVFGEGTEDTRRRVAPAELLGGPDGQAVASVLERLTAERLITRDEESVTVAHEALIRGWPRLRGWLNDDRDRLRAHRRLTEAAIDWNEHDREESLLYRGTRLALWEHYAPDRLNGLERDFLAASRRLATREQMVSRRRSRRALIGLGVTVAVVSVLAAMALVQADRADGKRMLALSRQLTVEARSQLELDPKAALSLARQAMLAEPTREAEMVLRQAVADYRARAVIPVPGGRALGVAFSPDGQRLAGTGADGVVLIWTWSGDGVSVSDPLTLRGHHGEAWSPTFSPDGGRLATAGFDGTVRIWEVHGGGAPLVLRGHTGAVWSVDFGPDGQQVASVGDDGTVRIWDVKGRKAPVVLRGHRGTAVGVAFSPDGRRVASSGHDHTVRIWDLVGGGEPVVLRGHEDATKTLSFSPDGESLASTSIDGTARVWDASGSGTPLVLRRHQGTLEGLAYSPDGWWIATTSDDTTVRVWSRTGDGEPLVLRGHKGTVFSVSFSSDGSRLASAGEDGTIRIWDPRGAGEPVMLRGHDGAAWTAAFSPSGKKVFSGGADRALRVWDLADHTGPLVLPGHEDEILGLGVGPGDRLVATASRDGTVRVWDWAGAGTSSELRGHEGPVWVAAFSPDGRQVATAGKDGTLRVWRTTGDGTPLVRRADADQIRYVAFSPDGTRLVTGGSDGTVRIWDTTGVAEPLVLDGHEGLVWSVAFSPDGRTVASAGKDGTVRIWPISGGDGPLILRGHQSFVWHVTFSPDGNWVASAGQDGTVRIWPADSASSGVTFRGFGASVETVAFSPDSQRLVTAHGDGTVRVWRCEVCGPVDHLLEMAGSFANPSAVPTR